MLEVGWVDCTALMIATKALHVTIQLAHGYQCMLLIAFFGSILPVGGVLLRYTLLLSA